MPNTEVKYKKNQKVWIDNNSYGYHGLALKSLATVLSLPNTNGCMSNELRVEGVSRTNGASMQQYVLLEHIKPFCCKLKKPV